MLVFSAAVNAQTTVSGTVSDSNGPIPGVNIFVKGTKISSVSNFDGTYTISPVPANATLSFSFIGYKAKEVAAANKSKIDVVLNSEALIILDGIEINRNGKSITSKNKKKWKFYIGIGGNGYRQNIPFQKLE